MMYQILIKMILIIRIIVDGQNDLKYLDPLVGCNPISECNVNGVCILGSNNKQECVCLDQYVKGASCNETVNNCISSNYMGKCVDGVCVTLFGSTFCDCKHKGSHGETLGRYCENERQYSQAHWCKEANFVFEHIGDLGSDASAFILCKVLDDPLNTHNMHQRVVVSFFNMVKTFTVNEFQKLEDLSPKILSAYLNYFAVAVRVPPELMDKHVVFKRMKFARTHRGPAYFKLILIDDLRFYLTQSWTGYQIQNYATYTFQSYTQSAECQPDIRLGGGGFSALFTSAAMVVPKKIYKVTTVRKAFCEKEADTTIKNFAIRLSGDLPDFYPSKLNYLTLSYTHKWPFNVRNGSTTFQVADIYHLVNNSLQRYYANCKLEVVEHPLTTKISGKKYTTAYIAGWFIVPESDLPVSKIEGGNWVYIGYQNITMRAVTYRDPDEIIPVTYDATPPQTLPQVIDNVDLKLKWFCTSTVRLCRYLCVNITRENYNSDPLMNNYVEWTFRFTDAQLSKALDCDVEVKLQTIYSITNSNGSIWTSTKLTVKIRHTFNGPVLGLKCLKNCYWLDYPGLVIMSDPNEVLYLEEYCFSGCHEKREISCAYLDESSQLVVFEDLMYYGYNPDNVCMFKAGSFPTEDRLIIGLQADYDNHRTVRQHGELWLQLRVVPINRSVAIGELMANYESCPDNMVTRGRSFTTDYEFCIPDMSKRFTGFTYMFFQTYPDYPKGVMIAWGQSNYISDIILGAHFGQKITAIIRQDLTDIESEYDYPMVTVFSSKKTSDTVQHHIDFISNVFKGNWTHRASVSVNFKNNEITEIVQKIHAIFLEKQYIFSLYLNVETVIYVQATTMSMFAMFYENVPKLEFTVSVELYQLSTLMNEIMVLSTYPISRKYVENVSIAVNYMLEHLDPIIKPTSKGRTNKAIQIATRLIECLTIIIYPVDELESNETYGAYTLKIIDSALEADIPFELEPIQEPDSSESDFNDVKEALLEPYKKSSNNVMAGVTYITHLLAYLLIPFDANTTWPEIILGRTDNLPFNFHIIIKTAPVSFFRKIQVLGDPNVGLIYFDNHFGEENINITKLRKYGRASAVVFFSIEFIVSPFMPFWWTNSSKYLLDFTFQVRLTKYEKNFARQLDAEEEIAEWVRVVFSTKGMARNFTMSQAIYYENETGINQDELSLSIHRVFVNRFTPDTLLLEFDLIDGLPLQISIAAVTVPIASHVPIPPFTTEPSHDSSHGGHDSSHGGHDSSHGGHDSSHGDHDSSHGGHDSSHGHHRRAYDHGQPIIQVNSLVDASHRTILLNFREQLNVTLPNDLELPIYIVARPVAQNTLYGLAISAIQCDLWNPTKYVWSKACDGITMEHNKDLVCICLTNHTNVYGVSFTPIDMETYGWMYIEIDFELKTCYICFVTLMLLLTLFLASFTYGAILDLFEYKKKTVKYLIDNRRNEIYPYVIIVCSALGKKTTSTIGLKLYGVHDNSKRHILREVGYRKKKWHWPPHSIEYYVLTTAEPIGNLRAIELWIDHRGHNPEWYCEKIIVRDYKVNIEWVFMVNKRFSLASPKYKVHHICYQKILNPKSYVEEIYESDQFFLVHLWFGLFNRKYCNSYSRKEHVTVAFSVMFMALMFLMHRIGIVDYNRKALVDEGFIQWDHVIEYGLTSLGLSILFNYPLMYVMRNTEIGFKPKHRHDFSGLDPTAPIPMYGLLFFFKYIAWGITICYMIYSSYVISFQGFSFGGTKSLEWLITGCLIFIFDVFVVESIHVILRNIVWNVVLGHVDINLFCNELIDLKYQNQIKFAQNRNKMRIISADMAKPLTKLVETVLRLREEEFFSYRKYLINKAFFTLLLICVVYVLSGNIEIDNAYYSSLVLKKMLVEGLYTYTTPLQNITHDSDFLYFINYTLLISLHWKRPSWLISGDRKILGVVRLRQLRVKPIRTCTVYRPMVQMVGDICDGPYNIRNKDTATYSYNWMPYNKSRDRYLPDIIPFSYHHSDQVEYIPLYGFWNPIPTGGYETLFRRTLLGSRNTFNKLMERHWINPQTRITVIEFTVFGADANFINFVQLASERTQADTYHNSYKITTVHLNPPDLKYNVVLMVIPGAFVVVLVLICFFYIEDHSDRGIFSYILLYLSFNDFLIIFTTFIFIAFFLNTQVATRQALIKIDRSLPNEYLDFTNTFQLKYLTVITGSLIIFLILPKYSRYFANIRFFHPFFLAVNICYPFPVIVLIISIVSCVLAALLLNLISFSTVIYYLVIPFGLRRQEVVHKEFLTSYSYFPLMNSVFFVLFRVVTVTLFIIVVRISYHSALNVRRIVISNRFPFTHYVKERIFRRADDMENLRIHGENRRKRHIYFRLKEKELEKSQF